MEELKVKPITQRASSVSDSKSYESKTPLESKKKMEKCQPGGAPNAVQSREQLFWIETKIWRSNRDGSKSKIVDWTSSWKQIFISKVSITRKYPGRWYTSYQMLSNHKKTRNERKLVVNSIDQSSSNSSLETFKVSNTFKGLGVIYKYRNILYAMLLGLQGKSRHSVYVWYKSLRHQCQTWVP